MGKHKRIRLILEGLEGIVQIKDDIVVHGKGKEHDRRLEKMERLEEHGLTLNKDKCEFGEAQVRWFGRIFNRQGMSSDPDRVEYIKSWKEPVDKTEVKSFLQTIQFCQEFMSPGDGRTYSDVTRPLRRLTAKDVRFKWTKERQASFVELEEVAVVRQGLGVL